MAEYFLGLVAKARYLVGAPSEVELVLNLSHHFPRNVCSRLSSCQDIKSAYSMLQIEDHHNNNTQRTNWKRTPEGANNAAVASGSGTGGNSRNWRDAGSNNRAVRATTAEADDDAEPETHPIANIFVGPEELLAEDNVDNSCVKVEKSPVIEVLIGERPMLVLLDSGSELSCIDGNLYREVKAIGVEMCELPVQKTTIQGAFGGKKKTISNQIFLPLYISGEAQWRETVPSISIYDSRSVYHDDPDGSNIGRDEKKTERKCSF
ncbi:hypothetical protein pipiens_001798 [Culex pipiens pipiens]|uniref:Uncharacterized protein n=1 Tax=Culex pipiens pipiens TaxID=38569 RepID=A0ABD1DUH4_CULPP